MKKYYNIKIIKNHYIIFDSLIFGASEIEAYEKLKEKIKTIIIELSEGEELKIIKLED